jgi:hypothetical protein
VNEVFLDGHHELHAEIMLTVAYISLASLYTAQLGVCRLILCRFRAALQAESKSPPSRPRYSLVLHTTLSNASPLLVHPYWLTCFQTSPAAVSILRPSL